MSEHRDRIVFRKDAFGLVEAINSYEDVPERVRWTIALTHKRAGYDGPISMVLAKEYDADRWLVETRARKQAA